MKFCCNTCFTLPKQSQNLDTSYKTDLNFRHCFGRKKIPSYYRRNMYGKHQKFISAKNGNFFFCLQYVWKCTVSLTNNVNVNFEQQSTYFSLNLSIIINTEYDRTFSAIEGALELSGNSNLTAATSPSVMKLWRILTHCILVDSSTVICWKSSFVI